MHVVLVLLIVKVCAHIMFVFFPFAVPPLRSGHPLMGRETSIHVNAEDSSHVFKRSVHYADILRQIEESTVINKQRGMGLGYR